MVGVNPAIAFLAGIFFAALVFVAAFGGIVAFGYTLTRDVLDRDNAETVTPADLDEEDQ